MEISGIVKSSLVDYPDLISCVLFVRNCNYSCFYCHNRSLTDGTLEVIDIQYIINFLTRRVGLLDGVVITGGEPSLQPDIIPFIKTIKDFGYKIKLDTNGSMPRIIEKMLKENLCDYYAVDYKAPADRYKEICGIAADAEAVLETINMLLEYNNYFEIRTTVIPQLNETDFIQMSKELPTVPKYVLNRYRKPDEYCICDQSKIEQKPYSQVQINDLADVIRVYQPNVIT